MSNEPARSSRQPSPGPSPGASRGASPGPSPGPDHAAEGVDPDAGIDASGRSVSRQLALWVGRANLRGTRFAPSQLLALPLRLWLRARLGAKAITLRTHDDQRMAALWLKGRSRSDSARSRPGTGRLPVVMTHGFGEAKELHWRWARRLQRFGHDVLLFDLRAHGQSGGKATSLGTWEKLDTQVLIEQLIDRGIVMDKVIAMGYSTGAAVVIQAAADNDRIEAVVALTPFSGMAPAVASFHKRFGSPMNEPTVLEGFARAARELGFEMDAQATVNAMARLTQPVLLIVGESDRHLPLAEHGRVLADAAKPGVCRLIEVPGATHLTVYRKRWRFVEAAVLRFCGRAGHGR